MKHLKMCALSLLLFVLALPSIAQTPIPTSALGEMHWREIGPFRGGRTRAAVGVPSQPNVFYIGAVNGGVWKTTDFGRTWHPIFDDQPTGSIGAIAVAPSDPNIVYVGSGEGLHRPDLSVGDGIYKSTDAGTTWTHLGLRDGQQISQMAVDPHDPNRLFVAVAGHPYGPNPERGIYRSTDGGQTFEKVLYKDENIGGSDVKIDPVEPQHRLCHIVGGAGRPVGERRMERHRRRHLQVNRRRHRPGISLPADLPTGIVQAYVAIARSNPKRLFAAVATEGQGRALSLRRRRRNLDDRYHRSASQRAASAAATCRVPPIDPKNPDVIYITSTVTWKSTDGGKTWTAFRGAPGGDDYQNIWINPNDPKIIILTQRSGRHHHA